MGLGVPSTGPTLGCHRGSDSSKEFETRCIIVEPQADVKLGRGVGAGLSRGAGGGQGQRVWWERAGQWGGGDTAPLPPQRAVGRASSHRPPPRSTLRPVPTPSQGSLGAKGVSPSHTTKGQRAGGGTCGFRPQRRLTLMS